MTREAGTAQKLLYLLLFAGALAAPSTNAQTAASPAKAQAATAKAQSPPSYATTVAPVFKQTCVLCHNATLTSGGLNLTPFIDGSSLVEHREQWDKIIGRLSRGEMPPPGIPKPAGLGDMIAYVQQELQRVDRNAKPDPGRVTLRRLNRVEYRNTVRDLLAVDYQADKEFPVDDSGAGFDNIADVLTVSPLLMEKYMAAAERIAARAVGGNALPKPVTVAYADPSSYREDVPFGGSASPAHRLGYTGLECVHRIEFDGDYIFRAGLAGARGPDGKPVTLGFWMDGKLLKSVQTPTTPPDTKLFAPYSNEEIRVFLTEGLHTFRITFMGDDFAKYFSKADALNPKMNKYPHMMTFTGPYPSTQELPSRKKILTCDPASGAPCEQTILATLARRAYRRPVSPAEVASLMKFVALSQKEGLTPDQGIQTAIEAMLVSPNFLFRMERDRVPTRVHPVSDLELASRLSYFLWSSMPDDKLLRLASTGQLRAPGVLEAQVRRMLADPRSSALAENFAGQWLETRNLDVVRPDPQRFPEWDPELREDMKTETRMFFDSILRENRPISEFLSARYTFLNERLAKFYGIDGVTGPEFRRVELTSEQRGGLLGQAAILTVSSYPSRTSVVIRGKYILENILGTPPPPPPPGVPALNEDAIGASETLRQQMEKHRSSPMCASCHSKMDPLGFSLENYDGIGKWRSMDGKFPVDSSGTLPDGHTFTGPAEMRTLLSGNVSMFGRCITEKMLIYALGRGLEPYDNRTVDDINRRWAASGYRFQTLIFEVVRSLPFQSRRGEATLEAALK